MKWEDYKVLDQSQRSYIKYLNDEEMFIAIFFVMMNIMFLGLYVILAGLLSLDKFPLDVFSTLLKTTNAVHGITFLVFLIYVFYNYFRQRSLLKRWKQ